jgi:endonuclease/exonuclease/phosphatase family metal-dependent hydrolase
MKITVLQWNVWYREKADKILHFIKETNADILCLQELTADSYINPGRDLPAEIGELGYRTYYMAALRVGGEEYRQLGNGIFSRYPLSEPKTVYTQRATPGQQDQEDRLYLEADIKIGGKNLTVGTAHLSWTIGWKPNPYKKAETDNLIGAIEHHGSNYILTGDMNALPGSDVISRLDDFLVPAGPDYSRGTWTTKPYDFGDFKPSSPDWRLDYVYTTPDVTVLTSKILETDASDHLPILVGIEV